MAQRSDPTKQISYGHIDNRAIAAWRTLCGTLMPACCSCY